MILNDTSVIPYLQFPKIKEFSFVCHGIFTRIGGVSLPPFDELNISVSTGDAEADIKKNRELIFRQMGESELVFARQVHGDGIVFVERIPDDPKSTKFRHCGDGDAMVTPIPGINLVLQVADCQPVLLLDPVKKVVANVHSGWRGSVLNIVGKAIIEMNDRYGCDPADIRAGIGPSLGPCCSEFINYKNEIPEYLWKYKHDHHYFNFWALTVDQLLGQGVAEKNIDISSICTKCHSDRFFSYRKEKQTGRFASVIGMVFD